MSTYQCINASDVPGWVDPLQHKYYQKISNQLPSHPKFLEIGCGWGRSTWGWLDVLPPTTEYYIVDLFTLHYPTLEQEQLDYLMPYTAEVNNYLNSSYSSNKTQQDILTELISQHPNYNIVKNIIPTSFQDAKQQLRNIQFDGVYLDADHDYNEVYDQLEFFKDTPVLCGDDIHWQEVRNALFDWAEKFNKEPKIVPGCNMFVANYIT